MKIIVSLCSAVVWGSGQIINMQKIKGLLFFAMQCIFLFIELSTGTLNVLMGISEPSFRNCGYFTKGLWGIITLGETPRLDSTVLAFDHSIMLMIGGIISTVVLLIFALLWIWNIRDAYRSRVKIEQGERVSSIDYIKDLWKSSFEYIMITPGAILVLFISVIPVLFTSLIAFTNYNFNAIPPKQLVDWTGFKTFIDIVNLPIWSSTFLRILSWTIAWAFLATFFPFTLGLLASVMVNAKGIRFKALWRGIYILPWAVPGLVSLLVFSVMFTKDGAFNNLLLSAGIIKEAIPFLSNTNWARAVLVLVSMWLSFPYFMALISGVLTSLSPEMYEAAEIDGGNSWHKFRYISLPMILTATTPQIVMTIIGNFNNFGAVYFLTGGGPANPKYQLAGTTDLLITWIFKLTLDQRMYNYASALSLLIFIVISTFSVINLLRSRVYKED